MARKKKGETPIEKIIVGIVITVASTLIIAWATGAFDSDPKQDNNTNTTHPSAGPKVGQKKPGAK